MLGLLPRLWDREFTRLPLTHVMLHLYILRFLSTLHCLPGSSLLTMWASSTLDDASTVSLVNYAFRRNNNDFDGAEKTKLVIFLSSSGEGHFETSVSPLSEDDVTQDADFIHGYPIAGCGLVFTSVLGPMHRLTVAVLLTWLVLPSGRLLPSLIRSLHPGRFVVRAFVLLPLSGEDQVCRHHSILQVNTITSGILSSGTGSTLTASCGKDSDQRHRRRISLWTTAKAVAILKSLHIAVSTIFYSNDSTIVNTILFQYTNYYEDNYPNKIKART